MGIFGKPDIEKMLKKRDVDGLTKALGDEDYVVRAKAAEALGKIGDRRAVEPLIEELRAPYYRERNSGPYSVHRDAAEALGRIGDPRAVEPLIKALRHPVIRDVAAEALGKIGDPRAVEPLIKALRHPDIRDAAAEALGRIGDPRAVKPLEKALRDEETYGEARAARTALVKLGARRDFDGLIKELRARRDIDGLIKELRARRDIDGLIKLLEDEDPDVREKVADVLGKIGDPRAVEPLLEALRHSSFDFHHGALWEAVEALGKMGKEAVEPLIEALGNCNKPDGRWWDAPYVHEGIIVALGEIGDRRAVEPLIEELRAPYYRDSIHSDAAEALGKIGDPRAVEPLIKALRHPDIRSAAAEALGRIGDPRAVEPLEKVLRDKGPYVRKAAKAALERIRRGIEGKGRR